MDECNATPFRGADASELSSRRVCNAIDRVHAELTGAMQKHSPMNSAHEAYSVILEEVDEFWEEVKKRRELRRTRDMRKELEQIAAMAIRAIIDLRLDAE